LSTRAVKLDAGGIVGVRPVAVPAAAAATTASVRSERILVRMAFLPSVRAP
jgi:hypothetical protein